MAYNKYITTTTQLFIYNQNVYTMKTTFKKVNSFKDVKTGTVYSTTNFRMFKTLKFNRGRDNSIEPKRVQDFKKLHERGEYFTDVIHLFVNLYGVIIDGHHKLEMHKSIKLPINFTVLPQAEFNEGTEIEILGAIARFNAKTSKWDANAHFDTALKCGEPVALEIAKLKAKYDLKYGFKKNLLTAGRIHTLIKEDPTALKSTLKTVEDYCDKSMIVSMSDKKFKKEFDFVCAVLSAVNDWNEVHKQDSFVTPFFVIRAVMPKVWDNELNMEKFYHNMQKKGLYISNTLNAVKAWADEVSAMRIKKTETVGSW